MESHSTRLDDLDPAAADEALASVARDRRDIAARFAAETWWAAPAQGGGVALLVAAPAAGLPWMGVISGFAVLALVGVESRFRRRTGMSVSRPAGPWGVGLLVLGVVVMVVGTGASLALSLSGSTVWVPLVVAAAFVLTTALVIAYDRVYAHEVRRVR